MGEGGGGGLYPPYKYYRRAGGALHPFNAGGEVASTPELWGEERNPLAPFGTANLYQLKMQNYQFKKAIF